MRTSAKPGRKQQHNMKNNNVLSEAYEGVTFTRRPSSGRPGTPHSYFEASYNVHFAEKSSTAAATTTTTTTTHSETEDKYSIFPQQVVHTHVNGLAVVTAGIGSYGFPLPDASASSLSRTIQAIDVVAQVADVAHQSAGKKRKRQSQMLKQKSKKRMNNINSNVSSNISYDSSVVYPRDVLANVQSTTSSTSKENNKEQEEDSNHADEMITASSNTTTIPLHCCVYGSILEINSRLSDHPQIIQDDPLLDGFLAIILPSGPFPPPSSIRTVEMNQEQQLP
jgi:glycine cleavage system H lipoate-binding protein